MTKCRISRRPFLVDDIRAAPDISFILVCRALWLADNVSEWSAAPCGRWCSAVNVSSSGPAVRNKVLELSALMLIYSTPFGGVIN
ncbi:MAG: hypothetical protein LC742_00020 [Acidobacteria bacterium]|nr:hypothetical protein [Acidobacteriota bacterium]